MRGEQRTSRLPLAEALFSRNFDAAELLIDSGIRLWKRAGMLPAGHAPYDYHAPPARVLNKIKVLPAKMAEKMNIVGTIVKEPLDMKMCAELGRLAQGCSEYKTGWVTDISLLRHAKCVDLAFEKVEKIVEEARRQDVQEELRRAEKEEGVRRLEKLEVKLIGKLRDAQELQQQAYGELEEALTGPL